MRQSMRRSEDDYAKKLDEMHERVRQRPLLLEHDLKQKAVRDLEKKFQHAQNRHTQRESVSVAKQTKIKNRTNTNVCDLSSPSTLF